MDIGYVCLIDSLPPRRRAFRRQVCGKRENKREGMSGRETVKDRELFFGGNPGPIYIRCLSPQIIHFSTLICPSPCPVVSLYARKDLQS